MIVDLKKLRRLSGLTRRSSVKRWLKANGVPYMVQPTGDPVTTLDAINRALYGSGKFSEPDFTAPPCVRPKSTRRASMKFQVQMKDPDVLSDAIDEAVKAQLRAQGITDEEELNALTDMRHDRIGALCSKWFRHGEYLTVEIDTDAGTCTVVPARS